MHPSKVIKDPKINDTYYDPDLDKLYQYVKLGTIRLNGSKQVLRKMMKTILFRWLIYLKKNDLIDFNRHHLHPHQYWQLLNYCLKKLQNHHLLLLRQFL